MRYQGKIHNWKDDQGFGFVTPNGGGERAFVHIKAFGPRSRRPLEGELIYYRVTQDSKRRLQATDIRFATDSIDTAEHAGATHWGRLPICLLLLVLAIAVPSGRLSPWVPVMYLALSTLSFMLYWQDKSAAQNGGWRTPESRLQLCSLAGGWPGALLAQQLLRHKSVKPGFQRVFKITVIINALALAYGLTPSGTALLRALLPA